MPKQAPTPAAIDRITKQHLAKLRKPGVLSVRPGFEITDHQLTGKSAIVATVHTKSSALPANQLLPNSIQGIPVDVREATPRQRLRAHDPAAAAIAQTFGRSEEDDPVWPFEREMPSGRTLDDPKSENQKALQRHAIEQPELAKALAAHAKKPQITYAPPPNHPLVPIQTTTTITAHASPDAGFATLSAFLQGTKQSLVIGMYDFTSGPILSLFKGVLGGQKTLQMVLDNPAPNPTRNQTDAVTVEELNAALGSRSKITRALSRSDTLVSAWIFPSAYHIKVIVRDNSVMWLSSGNLNNSNQPDPAAPPKTEDRDWHVIVEDPTLANLFTAYLSNDFAVALPNQIGAGSVLDGAVADAAAKVAAETNPVPPRPLATTAAALVPPKVFNKITVRITPLLTPDNLPADPAQGQYLSNMVKLIASAQKKLYIQLQYIEASSAPGDYENLLKTIAARVAAGVDVRLIESQEFGEKWAEKMKSVGVDLTANISLQSNVHNKGFVIDSSTVVVSSQNFSPQGVRLNRDAGLIIESAGIAQYFEQIFLSDWTKKAKPVAAKTAAKPTRKPARGTR
jgi:phosphatidylserine/phosphatidylglycerophosphate/cardiolipin synthase-like enzyme